MLEGIYKVSFSSNVQDHGEGIVVIKNNAINGGVICPRFHGQFKRLI